jgi:hypothetical protein
VEVTGAPALASSGFAATVRVPARRSVEVFAEREDGTYARLPGGS